MGLITPKITRESYITSGQPAFTRKSVGGEKGYELLVAFHREATADDAYSQAGYLDMK